MDKLLNIDGGMPIRTADFELIQNAVNDSCKGILSSVGATTFILKGLIPSIGSGNITVSEGWIYTQSEIFYVPAATFTYDVTKSLSLSLNVYTEENRHFKDGHYHNCFERRRYALGYATEIPSGSISLDEITTINELINISVITSLKIRQQTISTSQLLFQSGFNIADNYQIPTISKNEFGDCVLTAAFLRTGDELTTHLLNLPLAFYPKADIPATYVKGDYTVGLCIIKGTGEVIVLDADAERPNFLRIQYNCVLTNNAENNIYDIPAAPLAPIVIEGGPFPET